MEALSFIVDGEFFAIDVSLVQTVVRKIPVTPVPTAPDEIVGIANFKGRVITVLSLHRFLEFVEAKPENKHGGVYSTVIFKPLYGDEDQLGLAIDKAGDLIDILVSEVKPYVHPSQEEGYSCISSIVEIDGTLYRIVDLHQISDRYKSAGDQSHKYAPAGNNADSSGINPVTYETEDEK